MRAVQDRRSGVSGLGPAGLVAAQLARAESAGRVAGFALSEARRRRAAELGWVNEVLDPRARSSVEFLMDRTGETVAPFGVQREDYTFAPRRQAGRRPCGYPGHHRAAAEHAGGMLAAPRLDLRPLVTRHLPLDRHGEGTDLLERQEAIKVRFHPWP